jgi:hypothetical protein
VPRSSVISPFARSSLGPLQVTSMSFTGSAPDPTLLMYCESWPGLRGVEFNPSDSDIYGI